MLEQIHGLDPDRVLALSYVPSIRRTGLSALWELDAMLGTLIATGTEPAITQIKLVWWRDALESLDMGRVPAEPLLQRLHRILLPAGVSGVVLARMPVAWQYLLEPGELGTQGLALYAEKRGRDLFAVSAELLGGAGSPMVANAGESWALVDLARRSSNAQEQQAALAAAGKRLVDCTERWPVPLRPLGMLVQLARRDVLRGADRIETPGSPARMVRMLRHHLTGR